jgi:hypothetical protein
VVTEALGVIAFAGFAGWLLMVAQNPRRD